MPDVVIIVFGMFAIAWIGSIVAALHSERQKSRRYAEHNHVQLSKTRAAIDVLKTWGFSPADIARIMGYEPGASPQEIEEYIKLSHSVSKHVDNVRRIQAELESLFPGDLQAQKAWLDEPHQGLRGRTPRFVAVYKSADHVPAYSGLATIVKLPYWPSRWDTQQVS